LGGHPGPGLGAALLGGGSRLGPGAPCQLRVRTGEADPVRASLRLPTPPPTTGALLLVFPGLRIEANERTELGDEYHSLVCG
jgi:hypothetical protein